MRGYKQLMSSATDNWSTPDWLFDRLNTEFGFTLDPCADERNARCPRYFTRVQDGLSRKWTGRVFMNPPYGAEISAWVEKAWWSMANGHAELVVCLLPARTDTSWWHRYVIRGEIRFIRGRLKFGRSVNSATFPSVVVVFDRVSADRYPVLREGRD